MMKILKKIKDHFAFPSPPPKITGKSGGRIPLPYGRSWPDPPPSKRSKEVDGYFQHGGGI